jgi:hypothetical protein
MVICHKSLVDGSKAIGFAAVQIAADCRLYQGLTVKADPSNTAPIWIGPANVQAAPHVQAGYALYPGDSAEFPIDSPELYAVSSDLNQHLTYWYA